MRDQRAKYFVAVLILAWPFLLCGDPADAWTVRPSGTGGNLYAVAYGSNQFVAVGQWGTILLSSNGADWVVTATNLASSLYGVTFGAGAFVAVGEQGSLFTSPDGIDWTQRDSTTTNVLHAVRWLEDRFIATGGNGTLLSSSNGVAWVQHDSGTTLTLNAVVRGQESFVAVGAGNTSASSIPYSSNGITWSNQSVDFSALSDIAFGQDRFVALGIRGKIYASSNGWDWMSLFQTVDTRYLFGILHTHGRFVAVGGPFTGGSQKIVTSPDGLQWTLHPVETAHTGTLRSVAYGNHTLVAVGDKGLILQSDSYFRLAAGPPFSDGARAWIFTGDVGRGYRFQFKNDAAAPNWIDVTNFTGTAEAIPLIDPAAREAAMRFYRVVSP